MSFDRAERARSASSPSHSAARIVDRARWPYRMKDLCDRTGVPRQVIHFYIQQGLVPEGHKTGRNMAYYGTEHVERVRAIRQLQHERFLPLKAIRAMFEERDEVFTPAQRRLLVEVRERLRDTLASSAGHRRETVRATEVLAQRSLDRTELDELVEAGLLGTTKNSRGDTLLARDDVWLLDAIADMRANGFSRELGFSARDLAVYEEGIADLFHREAAMLASRLSHLPPVRVAAMVERSLPIVNNLLARLHTARVRNFFAAL